MLPMSWVQRWQAQPALRVYDQIASGHRVDLRDDRCRPNLLVATATVAQLRALGSTNRPNGAM
jgi:hypothetical protein